MSGGKVFFHEAGEQGRPVVLLLHGAAFSSQTWEDIKTLQRLADEGFKVYAVDIPGGGKSKSEPSSVERSKLLSALVQELSIKGKFGLVSPSMSGAVSIPYLQTEAGASSVGAFVPVAPTSTDLLRENEVLQVPTLLVRGEKDHGLGTTSAAALKRVIDPALLTEYVVPNGNHPCYMDDPEGFNDKLVGFLKEKLGPHEEV